MQVLKELSPEFPETKFIDKKLDQNCQNENIFVEEVMYYRSTRATKPQA